MIPLMVSDYAAQLQIDAGTFGSIYQFYFSQRPRLVVISLSLVRPWLQQC